MNSNVMETRIHMGKDELKSLVSEVHETVATDKKKFSAADLWQIQKQMKSAARFTKRWNLN